MTTMFDTILLAISNHGIIEIIIYIIIINHINKYVICNKDITDINCSTIVGYNITYYISNEMIYARKL